MTKTIPTQTCMHCGKPGEVTVTDEEYAALLHDDRRTPLQKLAPSLSPEERELLISGTHAECWYEMFGDGDE